jgi:hypothetical protein
VTGYIILESLDEEIQESIDKYYKNVGTNIYLKENEEPLT